MMRPLGLGALVLVIFSAACSSSVESSGAAGHGGGGGGSVPICAAEAFPCCEPGQDDPCCAQCNPTTKVCGGSTGASCSADEYCDFANDECGSNGAFGVCAKRPPGVCGDIYQATCGCDGAIHGNWCEATQAGTDASNLGGCKPPPGTFGCGAHFCTLGAEYCKLSLPGTGDVPSQLECQPLPASCGSTPICDCLLGVSCGSNCLATADGGQLVTCDDG